MERNPLICILLIAASLAFVCQLVGFLSPGWLRITLHEYDEEFYALNLTETPEGLIGKDGNLMKERPPCPHPGHHNFTGRPRPPHPTRPWPHNYTGRPTRPWPHNFTGRPTPPWPHNHTGRPTPPWPHNYTGRPTPPWPHNFTGRPTPPWPHNHTGRHTPTGNHTEPPTRAWNYYQNRQRREISTKYDRRTEEWDEKTHKKGHKIDINLGLWFMSNCSHDKESHDSMQTRSCTVTTLEKAFKKSSHENFMDTLMTHKDDQRQRKGNSHYTLTMLRILLSLAVVLSLVANGSVFYLLKSEKNKIIGIVAAFSLLVSGLLVLSAVGKIAKVTHHVKESLTWSQGVVGEISAPYAMFVSGIGGVLSLLTAIVLIASLCLRARRKKFNCSGQSSFDNETYVSSNSEKKFSPLYLDPSQVAEPLPEKIKIDAP